MKGIGVTMSGGGHRASLFGLGVLLYLGDAGKLPEVTSIASVSGGSLTNGFIARTLDLSQLRDGASFERAMKPFARLLALRGSLFASRVTWVYVIVLAVTGLVVLIVPWVLPVPGVVQFLILLAAVLLWVGLVASRRSWVAARAFRTTLFSEGRSATLLREIHGAVDHVFCTTDLQSAEQVYFSKSFVYGFRFGLGSPADLPLHDVVQASACLPGAFPPRWFRSDRHRFTYPADQVPCPPLEDRPSRSPRYMVLTDGGVYDNMADQWALGFAARTKCWPALEAEHNEPRDLIVVNSSAGLGWTEFKRSLIPGLGELLSLLKVKDVLYDQTTATRRRMLRDRSNQGLLGQRMRVGLINIPQSPFDVSGEFAKHQGPAGDRARAALAALGDTRTEWETEASRNASEVATSLSKMGTDISARLLHHAYVLAMANLHVVLDYPLLPVPDRQRFVDLLEVP